LTNDNFEKTTYLSPKRGVTVDLILGDKNSKGERPLFVL